MSAGVHRHLPVLFDEVIEHLAIRPEGTYVDATFGRGGHSQGILARLNPDGRLIAADRDPAAVQAGTEMASGDPRLTVGHGRLGALREMLMDHGICGSVDGLLLDLGLSSPQLDDADRGFSFLHDGPLDMRMDPGFGPSAADWINTTGEDEIARVLAKYGEERAARRIARAICARRDEQRLTRTVELAELVERVNPRRGQGKHPATRTFQAIRIFINDELEELRGCLAQVPEILAVGGRLCVISFHSLEDRIVKRWLRDQSRVDPALADLPVLPDAAAPRMRLAGKAVRPSAAEIERNPRARSAVLRTGERIK